MNWPEKVTIKEVGPRDGLQNEKVMIPAQGKMDWIDQLSDTGLSYIEVTSFVHPKWIPQLSDAALVAKGIKRNPGVTYAALVPNQRGLESALEANIDEISVFMSSSETHNLKNINKSISDTFPIMKDVIGTAANSGKTVRGYISTVSAVLMKGRFRRNRFSVFVINCLSMESMRFHWVIPLGSHLQDKLPCSLNRQ